jgi:hypothetical protein
MYNEEEYKMMDEIENVALELKRKFAKLKRSVDDYIVDVECEAAVEDFLQNGPGGTDPE